jgi:CofD-related protein of GAK system
MADVVARVRSENFPDVERVSRCLETPEDGPRVLFFSGGSALRKFSRSFVEYTHRSIHLVTPFDSGGSSAPIREAFDMLAVGDLRNRLLALADESVPGVSVLHEILSERLKRSETREARFEVLKGLSEGRDSRLASVSAGQRQTLCTLLQAFVDRMPPGFDLGNASIGNLALAGGYLSHDCDIDSAITLFAGLVAARGVVAPVGSQNLHLAASLGDGSRLVGQHLLTGKEVPAIGSPIVDLELVSGLEDPQPTSGEAPQSVLDLVGDADLVCFPIGSFYTSVLAQLLPRGIGRALARVDCPKIYVANTETDPEQVGMTLADTVQRIVEAIRRDAGEDTPISKILNLVIIDSQAENRALPVDAERIEKMGIEVVALPLVEPGTALHAAPRRLCEILISLT